MIGELLTPGRIVLDLAVDLKDQVLQELGRLLQRDGVVLDLEGYLRDVMAREEQGSTGVGHGFAIPHAKSAYVKRPGMAMARTVNGVGVGSMDGSPARIFFLMAIPDGEHGDHLRVLSRVARLLMHPSFRDGLMGAKTSQEAQALIEEMEAQLD